MTLEASSSDATQPVQPAAKKLARARVRKIAAAPIPTAEEPAVIAAKDETMEEQIKTATDTTKAMFAEATTHTSNAAEKGAKLFEELGDLSRGNLEALVESGRIAARGFEAMGQEAAASAKRHYESSVAAMRTLTSVKSPTEFMKVQSDLMRQSFDALVAETSRSTEATLKLAGEIVQPIQNRMALAVEKVRAAA